MKKDVVTLVVPAYNGAGYIHRLLDSILYQTYPYIEVYVINDGSTDNTEEVVTSYYEKFQKTTKEIFLISQENAGQAEALNRGLKLVDGEYFAWPDCDDWYASPYSIQKMVDALANGGPEVGVARCAYQRIQEDTLECIQISHPSHIETPSNIFEDAVFNKPGFWVEPGGWMVKTEFLNQYIPDREIYTSRLTGQNTQILWPYLFYSKCISIDEPLYCYLVRKNSHSRGLFQDYETKIQQQVEYGKTFRAVINGIADLSEDKRAIYLQFISERINSQTMNVAILYDNGADVRKCVRHKHKSHEYIPFSVQDVFLYLLSYIPNGIKITNKCEHLLKRLMRCVWDHKLILSLSAILLTLCFIIVSPRVARKVHEYTFKPVSYSDADDFEEKILSGVISMLDDEYSTDETIIYYRNVFEYVSRILHRSNVRVYEYGEYGYLLYFTYMYAQQRGNEALKLRVREKFDKGFVNGNRSVTIKRNDQISYGCVATLLAQEGGGVNILYIVSFVTNYSTDLILWIKPTVLSYIMKATCVNTLME